MPGLVPNPRNTHRFLESFLTDDCFRWSPTTTGARPFCEMQESPKAESTDFALGGSVLGGATVTFCNELKLVPANPNNGPYAQAKHSVVDWITASEVETPSMESEPGSISSWTSTDVVLPLVSASENMLSKFFAFDDPAAVREFLESNPMVGGALQKLIGVLRNIVPTREPPILRVIVDPLDLASREMQVRVPLAMTAEQALAKIEEVDDAWWMNLSPEIRPIITVDAVYR